MRRRRPLKRRTLTALYNMRGTPEGAWLDTLHRVLDAAVAAAYGWPEEIGEDDALEQLLALNHARRGDPPLIAAKWATRPGQRAAGPVRNSETAQFMGPPEMS